MDKKRVVVTFVEAGQGHIVTAAAIADSLEKKYGDSVEVIRSYIFRDSNDLDLIKYEKFLVNEVKKSNKHPGYLAFQCAAMKLLTEQGTLEFSYNVAFRKIKNKTIKIFQELKPDIIISTHFSPAHFAVCGKKSGKLKNVQVITYDPDPNVHGWWDRRMDLLITNNSRATEEAIEKKHFKKDFVRQVNFLTRQSVVDTNESKAFYRKKYGIPENKFAVCLADGAYATAKLETFTDELLTSSFPLTIIPVVGKNEKLLEKYTALKETTSRNITLLPMPFMQNVQEVYKASDLFITKAGPNAILDSLFMGTPIMTNFYSGPIEKATNDLFVNYYKTGLFCKDEKEAVKLIGKFAKEPALLNEFIENTKQFNKSKNGADEVADIVFDCLQHPICNLKSVRKEALLKKEKRASRCS